MTTILSYKPTNNKTKGTLLLSQQRGHFYLALTTPNYTL